MSVGILALIALGAFMLALITGGIASSQYDRDGAVWFLIGFFAGPIAIVALLFFGKDAARASAQPPAPRQFAPGTPADWE